MKYLIIMIFSTSAFCNGYFVSKEEFESGSIKSSYTSMKFCKDKKGDCIKVPRNYNPETFDLVDEMVDDLEKPKFRKADKEDCLNESDCKEKLALKSCSNKSISPIINDLEVYCPEPNGYRQIKSGRKIFVVNESKKAQIKAIKDQEKADEQAEKQTIKDLKARIKDGSLTEQDIKKALLFLLKNI